MKVVSARLPLDIADEIGVLAAKAGVSPARWMANALELAVLASWKRNDD